MLGLRRRVEVAVEDVLLILRRDALAGVRDAQHGLSALPRERQAHKAAARRIVHGVRQEVLCDLREPQPLAPDDQPRLNLRLQRHACLPCQLRGLLALLPGDRAQVHARAGEHDLPILQLRHQKQVARQLRHEAQARGNQRHHRPDSLRAGLDDVQRAAHHRQRRADVVEDVEHHALALRLHVHELLRALAHQLVQVRRQPLLLRELPGKLPVDEEHRRQHQNDVVRPRARSDDVEAQALAHKQRVHAEKHHARAQAHQQHHRRQQHTRVPSSLRHRAGEDVDANRHQREIDDIAQQHQPQQIDRHRRQRHGVQPAAAHPCQRAGQARLRQRGAEADSDERKQREADLLHKGRRRRLPGYGDRRGPGEHHHEITREAEQIALAPLVHVQRERVEQHHRVRRGHRDVHAPRRRPQPAHHAVRAQVDGGRLLRVRRQRIGDAGLQAHRLAPQLRFAAVPAEQDALARPLLDEQARILRILRREHVCIARAALRLAGLRSRQRRVERKGQRAHQRHRRAGPREHPPYSRLSVHALISFTLSNHITKRLSRGVLLRYTDGRHTKEAAHGSRTADRG